MALHPVLKWAQRKDKIFITLNLRDIINQKISLKQNRFDFECESSGSKYELKIQLYGQIQEEKSQWKKTGFQIVFVLQKRDGGKGYWGRLTKQNKKSQYVQCDWQKWIDQDEQEQQGNKGLKDVDYENMNNFRDSDDEDEQGDMKKQGNLDDLQKGQQIEQAK